MSGKSGHGFGGGNALFLGLVSEHGTINAVTNSPDAGHCRAKMFIHDNPTQLVRLNTDTLQSETFRVGTSSRCHQTNIECFFRAITTF